MRPMDAPRERGQALVEFAISITVFLMLLMAIFDFGRGIYMYNGMAQAAREVARTASVHQPKQSPRQDWSTQAQATIATQKALIPGLSFLTPTCVASTAPNDSAGSNAGATGSDCAENEYLVVTARSAYTPVSLLGFLGTINLEAKSRIQIPLSQPK